MKRGQVTWSARQLGSWEVSYWLDSRDELRFVVRVRV
jgi:hypothetical protein